MHQRAWATNLLITAIGLILFAALTARSGRIEANDGLGWDGRQYAHMVTAVPAQAVVGFHPARSRVESGKED